MPKFSHRRKTMPTLLAASIGVALHLPLVAQAEAAVQAVAEEIAATRGASTSGSDPTTLDAIIVSGYRASVEKALDIKRGEAGVVDAIVAEDIGKFPDLNLAESLQRIPGVAITRDAGEGRNISVRGLGPDFTRVRINGMEALTTVGAADQSGGSNRSRGFDFNVFASDLFSQLIVRKSAQADVEEGSLGATVDLRTARPFDYDGFTLVASGQLSHNDLASKTDPRVAGLIANTWADGKIGALLSVARSERQLLEEGSGTGRWAQGTSNGNFSATSPFAAARRADIYHPRFPRYTLMAHEQTRTGATASFQFNPGEHTKFTLDALHSEIDATRDEQYIEAISFSRSGTGKPQTIVRDGVIENGALVYGLFDDVDIRSESRHDEWNTQFTQINLEGEHAFNDAFRIKAKIGTSESVHVNPIQTTIVMDKLNVDNYSFDYRNDPYRPTLNYGIDPRDPSGWTLAEIRIRPQEVTNEFDNAQLDADWTIGPGFSLKGGIQAKDYTFSTRELRRASELVVPTFSDGSRVVPVGLTALASLSGVNGIPGTWVIPSGPGIADLFDIYSNSGIFATTERAVNTRSVMEKDRGVYVMGEFSLELGSIPLLGNAGVRHVRTRQSSTGIATASGAPVVTTVSREYSDTLPSMNVVAEVTPDLLIRLGAAKVMSRPGLGSLTPGVTVSVAGGARTVSGGNPNLDPIRAKTVDLGIEWYFDEGALLGLGLFYKDIDSFTQTTREVRTYASSGLPAGLLDGTGATVDDEFAFTIPVNTPGGELTGLEASYTQPFTFLPDGWGNFGIQLNYTYVDSQIQYVSSAGANVLKTDLLGLSNHAWNATLYYEGGRFSGRVSATSRDDYLIQAPGAEAGFNVDGVHGQTGTTTFDASLRWAINEQFELSLEGINLTDEAQTSWVSNPTVTLPLDYSETGRQYLLGLRYTF